MDRTENFTLTMDGGYRNALLAVFGRYSNATAKEFVADLRQLKSCSGAIIRVKDAEAAAAIQIISSEHHSDFPFYITWGEGAEERTAHESTCDHDLVREIANYIERDRVARRGIAILEEDLSEMGRSLDEPDKMDEILDHMSELCTSLRAQLAALGGDGQARPTLLV
ncbi:hypothetical protein [Hyphomicrobium sp. 2TAF46]|uniref:hypothetical protein n=1 Tax=Hyphomicrobium sp. 2TAF46 TaxID=3233019 RepID=UPI003F9375C9